MNLPPTSLASNTRPVEPDRSETGARVREVVEREYSAVWRFLRRLGVPQVHVDDAAQLVFARVLAKDDMIQAGHERAYLMRAAFRVSCEHRRTRLRAAVRACDVDVEQVGSRDLPPDEALSRRRDRELLDRALDQLPDELRAVLTLFELDGMTFTEISEALEIPRGTVASRVRRARALFHRAVCHLHPGGLR